MVRATVLLCAAESGHDYWQPCAEMKYSKSKMRKLTDRRVAVQSSQKKELLLRQCLDVASDFKVDAAEFVPGHDAYGGWEYGRALESVLDYLKPEDEASTADWSAWQINRVFDYLVPATGAEVVPRRRPLKEPQSVACDNCLSCPASPVSYGCLVTTLKNDSGMEHVPSKSVLRETMRVESLPVIANPAKNDISIVAASTHIADSSLDVWCPTSDYFLEHLEAVRTRCGEIVAHLKRAACLARSIQGSSRHSGDTQEAIAAEFYEDYYDRFDPVGVAELREENTMIEGRFCNIELNYLGHLLVGSAPQFYRHVMANPLPQVANQLLELANSIPTNVISNSTLSRSEYEETYLHHAQAAFAWQECFDEADLLNVFRLLRDYVKTSECLLYIDD